LSQTFQKRNYDAPLVRFLPGTSSYARREKEEPAVQSLPEEEIRDYLTVATSFNSSLSAWFLAGFAALLSRMTRQDVITVSVGTGELALFNLEGDCSFREALRQASHRESQAPELIACDIEEHGLEYEFREATPDAIGDRNSGLRLLVLDQGTRLDLSSPAGLWDEVMLQGWLGSMRTLMQAAMQNPDVPLNHLPLWNEVSAHSFYAALNETKKEFLGEPTVPGRFAQQAKRRTGHPATVSDGRQYTYGELDQRSTELALDLVAAGAGPNRAVAVCMERSVDLPMALLAVLKSGSYYVPLDPHNPSQRLRGILEECAPVALLSDTGVAPSLVDAFEAKSLPLFCVDEPRSMKAGNAVLPVAIDATTLAYTIYTSGTTGKPKGVRITHGALLNLICSMSEAPGIRETDRTLAVAPISFDIATMDMFLPICSGGTLFVASRQDAVDPFRLAHLIREHDITCMQATPATWRMLVTSEWSGQRGLKMITGGEAIPRQLANDLMRVGGELWNCYGPTETTIYSGVIQLKPEAGIVPVGGPIANTSFYVMDQTGYPLPPGVPGELYIGGKGVSPGYVARPELTADRFIEDRFGTEPGGTVFRTGDLVRIVNGNEFEFFGRLDHQVKLRGFRIELGEIESVLRAHPLIKDAVVVLREDVPGEPRLVAYVIAPGPQLGAAELRAHAAQSLPEYMLPAIIVTLDRYPLSASGKINRRALPPPEALPGQIAPDHPEAAAAQGELETKLLAIFREVLRNDTIGVTDSFFRYGGYSLLTVRLFSRIDRELQVRLPISLLFDAPTVRELARVIEQGSAPSIIVPVRPQGTLAPIFVVQSYLLYNAMLEIVEADRPIYGVREMADETEPLKVEIRARMFAREILNVYSGGPLYLAGWCAAGTLTVEIARQLREAGHTVGLVALFDAERPGYAPPKGIGVWSNRMWAKAMFHLRRILTIPWKEKLNYLYEAMVRNWDWAIESFYTAHFHSMLWLNKRFGVSLSETAFNNVYASLAALRDFSVRPYPGRLTLYRAADVPGFHGMDETLGWGTIATEGVDVEFVPGDHVSMFKKPHVASLAYRLQSELQKAESHAVHG
jgi:amino acid adenylation domain-containing protein